MNKTSKSSILAIVAISIWIGTFLSPILTCGDQRSGSLYLTADPSGKTSPAIAQAITLENAFQEVFDRVSPSVVSIATERTVDISNRQIPMDPFFEHFFGRRPNGPGGQQMKQKQTGLGSGLILNEEGYIMTNHHVVKDMDKLTVKLKNQKTFEAQLIGSDELMDIALLKIKAGKSEITPIVLGNSEKVRVGNWAIAIGAPLGFEQSFTVGVVSAIQRGGIDASGLSYIQTDAAINQGNSGGPLLNINGEVVGINRMIASQSGGSVGIGFAIPINEAKRVAEELRQNGKVIRPWLGVGLDNVTEEDKAQLGLSSLNGAIVRQIIKGSPADQAGLQLNDVITKYEGNDIKSPEELINYVRASKIGKRIEIRFTRKKNEIIASIIPRERPN
ncbi:trypsin-like peptidase domain-containing protein [Leptospira sp. GIMC2001]|uniref:trypsin-like peptidase domain-containing protein n=1 Tax=Leptospira sp. GIMC2001 TaxID=1513297 RepID=UPI00234BF045|nr:trypsin-like peptidase domain-containing protein [Leptospira sp. GIMC2001]WCL49297.1 trypsin-like peptidase domain-containing protein [Leptospira sp. GIMC2001]